MPSSALKKPQDGNRHTAAAGDPVRDAERLAAVGRPRPAGQARRLRHRALRGRAVAFRFFFFNDTATTEIYTLSLHDALPIFDDSGVGDVGRPAVGGEDRSVEGDRKSTRLNSSHSQISYAVFCLKKKRKI